MLFKAFSKDVQVKGQNIIIYLGGMGAFEMMGRDILQKHNIDKNPQPDVWYNHQNFLDAMKEISERTGKSTVMTIGMRVAANASYSAEIKNMEQALGELNKSYHKVHKGDTHTTKIITKMNENIYKVVINSPYPCGFDMGYLRGLVKRFAPQQFVIVTHDEEQGCRTDGGESCTYLIRVTT